jgi:hypothetical protein
MTRVEDRLEKIVGAIPEILANGAAMRQEIAQHGERLSRLEGDVAGLRRDMPSIVAEAMREVLRRTKG